MKHFNWLVKALFYKHKDKEAAPGEERKDLIYYNVAYTDQEHANLCTNACKSMLRNFAQKPFASMAGNPYMPWDAGEWEKEFPDFLRNKGVDLDLTRIDTKPDDIRFMVKNNLKYGPFIMGLPLRGGIEHSIVVVGADDNHVIYHDPLTGPNREITYNELFKLVKEENAGILEVALPLNFYNQEALNACKTNQINFTPDLLYNSKHAKHFSIKKMENPTQAVKDFLNDYAENSKWWTRRTHRDEVKKFLKDNENVTDLERLVENLANTQFSNFKESGELASRIEAIKHYTNINKTINLKEQLLKDQSKTTSNCSSSMNEENKKTEQPVDGGYISLP